MFSYKSLTSSFYKLFISTYLLFFISIQTPFGGLTIDRMLVFVIFFLIIAKFKHRFSLFGSSIFSFIIFITLSKILYLGELHPKYSMALFCMLTLYISYRIGKLNIDFNRYIVFSYLIVLSISVYSISEFISNGVIPSSFSFLDSLPFVRSVNYEHMAEVNMSYLFPRLSLPYPTPPQLSLVLAMYSFYFLSQLLLKKSKLVFGLLLTSIMLMFATISRSGIIPFIVISFLYYNVASKKSFLSRYASLTISTALIIFSISVFSQDLTTILYDRFFGSSLSGFTSGHSSARLVGLNLFMEGSPVQMLFGQGIGNYIGIHAHMTTITYLVEIGLIGLFLFVFLFFQRIIICYRFYKRFPNNGGSHLYELMLLLMIFFAMALYEFTYVVPLYIFMGLAAGNSYNESRKLFRND